jgi:hypothetical protein
VGGRGLCLGAEKLEAKSLSKYDLCILSPFSNFNVVFGEGVRRTGGASARFVGQILKNTFDFVFFPCISNSNTKRY